MKTSKNLAAIPNHIAIIMDGNGRWAENKGLLRIKGHQAGVKTAKNIIKNCIDKSIKVLSLFAFSSENWLRPPSEVEFLMQLLVRALNQELEILHHHQVKVRFSGKRTQLSSDLLAEMQRAEQITAKNSGLILNIAINYGGKWDILEAVKLIIDDVRTKAITTEALNEKVFDTYLNTYDLPDPDLFIRTSGEQRISNFYLWQLAYTEMYFSEVFWPDFSTEEFEKALLCYSQRKRRYGKLSNQPDEEHYV